MPDFEEYHRSVTSELDAVKNRIRNLVTHWATDGEWKEAALRTVLRRHLPGSALVGRAFTVGPGLGSRQIDLFVLKPEKPTVFRDGELAVVTPDVPGAIVEVKTSLEGAAAWYDAVTKLASHGQLCRDWAKSKPWLGLFTYDGCTRQAHHILDAVCRVHRETAIAINCVTCGYDLFVRYWPVGECERGDDAAVDLARTYWRAYDLPRLAPPYFVGNLVDAICHVDRTEAAYAWFAYECGKHRYMLAEKRGEECEPEE